VKGEGRGGERMGGRRATDQMIRYDKVKQTFIVSRRP
jgi:hypothetical protein